VALELVRKVKVTKIYSDDLRFIEYLSRLKKIPKIHLLSLSVSLLALSILKPNEVYRLYEEAIKGYEKGR